MENYLLCGAVSNLNPSSSASLSGREGSSSSIVTLYKGRKRGTVEFVGIWRHCRAAKDLVANNVKYLHRLSHDNVLKFCEWYETSKHVWVITELTSGGTLAQILEQDSHIPPSKMADFFSDICSGLRYLHSVEVLYCDLQPNKIVLDTCCNLKLCDFSLAVSVTGSLSGHGIVGPSQADFRSAVREWFQLQDEGNIRTKSGQRNERSEVGGAVTLADRVPCPLFASPELYRGSGFTAAGDMWALGCVALEMLSGRQPFSRHDSLDTLEAAVCRGWSAVAVDLSLSGDGEEEDQLLGVWLSLVRGLLTVTPSQRFSWEEVNHMLRTSLSPDNNG